MWITFLPFKLKPKSYNRDTEMNPLGHLGIYFSIPPRNSTVCYKNWVLCFCQCLRKNLIILLIFPNPLTKLECLLVYPLLAIAMIVFQLQTLLYKLSRTQVFIFLEKQHRKPCLWAFVDPCTSLTLAVFWLGDLMKVTWLCSIQWIWQGYWWWACLGFGKDEMRQHMWMW